MKIALIDDVAEGLWASIDILKGAEERLKEQRGLVRTLLERHDVVIVRHETGGWNHIYFSSTTLEEAISLDLQVVFGHGNLSRIEHGDAPGGIRVSENVPTPFVYDLLAGIKQTEHATV